MSAGMDYGNGYQSELRKNIYNTMQKRKAEMDEIWRTILRNQFHDILPGSSIGEVYEVTDKEYAELFAETEKLLKERLERATPTGDGVSVWNTLGFERGTVVELGDVAATALTDGQNLYPVQKTADGHPLSGQGVCG